MYLSSYQPYQTNSVVKHKKQFHNLLPTKISNWFLLFRVKIGMSKPLEVENLYRHIDVIASNIGEISSGIIYTILVTHI